MYKEEYRREIRKRLGFVDLSERQTWLPIDVLGWWSDERKRDPSLARTCPPFNGEWQEIKTMCADLIGPNAIS